MASIHDRMKDAPWFTLGEYPPVLVGGAGGIGSWLSLLLTRAGFHPMIFDYDLLELHNLSGQLFPAKGIGKPKVTVLQEVIKDFADLSVEVFHEKIDANSMTHNIVFSAFDNMEARKDLFNSWEKMYAGDQQAVFIDGRLTAEQITIFVVKGWEPLAREAYRKYFLFDDSEVEDAPCTFKQTSHNAAIIAGIMVDFFVNWYSVNVTRRDPSRYVPFKWEVFTPTWFITEVAVVDDEQMLQFEHLYMAPLAMEAQQQQLDALYNPTEDGTIADEHRQMALPGNFDHEPEPEPGDDIEDVQEIPDDYPMYEPNSEPPEIEL